MCLVYKELCQFPVLIILIVTKVYLQQNFKDEVLNIACVKSFINDSFYLGMTTRIPLRGECSQLFLIT